MSKVYYSNNNGTIPLFSLFQHSNESFLRLVWFTIFLRFCWDFSVTTMKIAIIWLVTCCAIICLHCGNGNTYIYLANITGYTMVHQFLQHPYFDIDSNSYNTCQHFAIVLKISEGSQGLECNRCIVKSFYYICY